MKAQVNKHRTEIEFVVGDLVYLKLIPYQLQSLSSHSHHKLQPRFYGLYVVEARVGKVAYKLQLPADCKLHPVFHVSCLKKHLGDKVLTTTTLPLVTNDGLSQPILVAVLQRRMYKKGNGAGVQLLKCREDFTWEDFEDFTAKFPTFQF
ncbi:hypothetical protein FF1_003351 [Malus domestica]